MLSYDPDTDWHHAFAGMKAQTVGSFENLPACNPLPLGVEAEHWIVLDERCECTAQNNRWIELFANVRYDWSLFAGGGFLAPLANDSAQGSAKATTQQVLWHPPALNPDEEAQATILVTASNDDEEEKPVPLTLTGVFTIHVRRRAVQLPLALPDGTTLEREVQRNDYEVEFTCEPLYGGGGAEVIDTCEPSREWEAGSGIDGDFTAPALDLLRDDFVVLTATGDDHDVLKLWCSPWNSPCLPSPTMPLALPDTLRFEWSSSLGMPDLQFPAGRSGRQVVFSTKGSLVNQVTITLTISDSGVQFPDAPKTVSKVLTVLSGETSIDAAVIATVAPTPPPAKDERPPPASIGQMFSGTKFSQWYFGVPWPGVKVQHWFKPPPAPDRWYALLNWHGATPPRLEPYHPWEHALQAVSEGANDPPDMSYPNFDAVRTWALPAPGAKGAEHRGVYGVHLKTYARREVLVEIPNPADPAFLDVLLEHGWTPFTRGDLWPRIQGFVAFQELLPPYQRGDHQEQAAMLSGECSDTISFRHAVEFRLGEKALKLSERMTNRTPIWITSQYSAHLHLDDAPSLEHTSNPAFPTWDVYLGADGGDLSRIAHKPQESALEFINRGDRENKKGI